MSSGRDRRESKFSVARNKRPQRKGQTLKDRLKKFEIFTSTEVSNISPRNQSLWQKKWRTDNRVCDLKFFHFSSSRWMERL